MNIKDKINSFPKTPGIYLMKDKYKNIIYVGKSKKLQERIKTYFIKSNKRSKKIETMISLIDDIDIINTDTEFDALLLECKYIKQLRPMYNTLLKSHESYSYIKINMNEKYPYTEVINKKDDNSIYFGPYIKFRKLEGIKEILDELYELRHCKKMTKCFRYELNQCLGPCREKISIDDYNYNIQNLISDLSTSNENIINKLKEKMNLEISNLNFEKASIINDKINSIKSILNKQDVISKSIDNRIYFVWIDIDENVKCYLIQSAKIIKSEVIDKTLFNNMDKYKYIDENKIDIKSSEIDKYDMDFINIIYGYIENEKNISGKIII